MSDQDPSSSSSTAPSAAQPIQVPSSEALQGNGTPTTPSPSPSSASAIPHQQAQDPSRGPSSSTTNLYQRFSFPRAAQPEIVRAYQKDTYYKDLLTSQLGDVVGGLMGSRFLHTQTDTIALIGSLTYFALTSLGGSQTLGEEYVNVMMTDGRSGRIIRAKRRSAFILLHVLAPFLLTRLYSWTRRSVVRKKTLDDQKAQRERMRARATGNLEAQTGQKGGPGLWSRVVSYLAENLPTMETIKAQDGWLAYAGAAHLAIFYLGGRYYGVAQRLARAEYISSIPRRPGTQPPSYEVLGVLLGIQLVVKLGLSLNSWRVARRKALEEKEGLEKSGSSSSRGRNPFEEDRETVRIDERVYSHKTSPATLLPTSAWAGGGKRGDKGEKVIPGRSKGRPDKIPLLYPDPTRTPTEEVLGIERGGGGGKDDEAFQAAKVVSKAKATELEAIAQNILRCTLCMEERRPEKGGSSVTECGHVFCWDCIVGWAREKPECPLCRQSIHLSRILPIYNF